MPLKMSDNRPGMACSICSWRSTLTAASVLITGSTVLVATSVLGSCGAGGFSGVVCRRAVRTGLRAGLGFAAVRRFSTGASTVTGGKACCWLSGPVCAPVDEAKLTLISAPSEKLMKSAHARRSSQTIKHPRPHFWPGLAGDRIGGLAGWACPSRVLWPG